MRRNHQAASDQGDGHFRKVRGQTIAPPGSGRDAKQTASHEDQDTFAAVPAVSGKNGEAADCGHQDSQRAVKFFFRGNVVRPYGGEGDDDRRKDAMHKAHCGSDDS